jgi:hypothetical protein
VEGRRRTTGHLHGTKVGARAAEERRRTVAGNIRIFKNHPQVAFPSCTPIHAHVLSVPLGASSGYTAVPIPPSAVPAPVLKPLGWHGRFSLARHPTRSASLHVINHRHRGLGAIPTEAIPHRRPPPLTQAKGSRYHVRSTALILTVVSRHKH